MIVYKTPFEQPQVKTQSFEFTLAVKSRQVPLKRLTYPVPETGCLGKHLTLKLGSQTRFGPAEEWIHKIDYQVNDQSRQKFAQAIQTEWSERDPSKLAPTYSGIRPKLGKPK